MEGRFLAWAEGMWRTVDVSSIEDAGLAMQSPLGVGEPELGGVMDHVDRDLMRLKACCSRVSLLSFDVVVSACVVLKVD